MLHQLCSTFMLKGYKVNIKVMKDSDRFNIFKIVSYTYVKQLTVPQSETARLQLYEPLYAFFSPWVHFIPNLFLYVRQMWLFIRGLGMQFISLHILEDYSSFMWKFL